LALGKKYRFLGFPNDELSESTEIIILVLGVFPCKNIVGCVAPFYNVYKRH
jgi:hypothetical protein